MPSKTPLPQPAMRRLKVYAFDPNASLERGSAKFNQATISLAWGDPHKSDFIKPGPVNDYFEVIDIDPVSNLIYPPVDLDDPVLLAQDGLPPSEGDPRFHQQMVFAVAMKTVRLFERALGRKVLWASKWDSDQNTYIPTFQLRIYPHALREENAYYSRKQRALLFGYFKTSQRSTGANWVFTALSHDIIVHETTHAILDGMHPRLAEATSPDSLAFHEAFADIAALFSHFLLKEAVSHYISTNGGKLDQSGLLSGLASQFAMGTTGRASLRDYIDSKPDPDLLAATTKPHDRGAILVAAVFDAFLSIYSERVGDLLRIANAMPGTGGHLHPDLVERLTVEAMKTADHVLRMCIRALDYLPPVDVRFGDFLRGIVTADADLIADDKMNYRLAFVEAFRRRGIYADGCLSMSPDNLLWPTADETDEDDEPLLRVDDIQNQGLDLVPLFNRKAIFKQGEANRKKIWYWLAEPELKCVVADIDESLEAGEDKLTELVAKMEAAEGEAKLTYVAELERVAEAIRRQHARNKGPRKPDKKERKRFSEILTRIRKVVVDRELKSIQQSKAFVELNRADLEWLGFNDEQFKELVRLLHNACDTVKGGFESWKELYLHICESEKADPDLEADRRWEQKLGIFFRIPEVSDPSAPMLWSIRRRGHNATVQISTVRCTRRSGPDGENIRQMIIQVNQWRNAFFDSQRQRDCDIGKLEVIQKKLEAFTPEETARYNKGELCPQAEVDFVFRGGATLIIDLKDNRLRYVISKSIADDKRLQEQREMLQQPASLGFTYDRSRTAEPFAMLHRH